MMKRSKSTEARQQQAIEQKSALLKNVETADFLKIQPLTYRTDVLASFSDVSVIYDDRPVFQPMSFEIRRRERIFLDGKNRLWEEQFIKTAVRIRPGTYRYCGNRLRSCHFLRTARHLTFGRNTVSICRKTSFGRKFIQSNFAENGFRTRAVRKMISLIFPEDRRKKCSSQKVSVSRLIYMYGTNH